MTKRTYKLVKSELDDVMVQLQSPDTEIDVALVLHDKAQKLIVELEKYLSDIETGLRQPKS